MDKGSGEYSILAKAFLDILKENNDIIEWQRSGKEVSARLSYYTSVAMIEQIPQYAPISFDGHESGDFFFVPVKT